MHDRMLLLLIYVLLSCMTGCCYAFGNGTLIFKSYPSPSLIFVHESQSGYPHMSHLHFQLEVGNCVRWVPWLRKYPSILGITNFSEMTNVLSSLRAKFKKSKKKLLNLKRLPLTQCFTSFPKTSWAWAKCLWFSPWSLWIFCTKQRHIG
jgi:hypothetical protein